MIFTFCWCRSNQSVPVHRRCSFLNSRCQLKINFRNRFLNSCSRASASLRRSSRPLAASTFVFGPWSKRDKHRRPAWYLSVRKLLVPSQTVPMRSPYHTVSEDVLPPSGSSVDQCCNGQQVILHGCNRVFANVFPRGPLSTEYLSPTSSALWDSRSLCQVTSRLPQLWSQLRKLLCASEGWMRSLDHGENTTTDF